MLYKYNLSLVSIIYYKYFIYMYIYIFSYNISPFYIMPAASLDLPLIYINKYKKLRLYAYIIRLV